MKYILLLFLLFSSQSFSQLRPIGLQSDLVVALAAEQGDPGGVWFPFTANLIFAATNRGAVFQGRTWDDGKSWVSLGPFVDPPHEVVAMTVQHWGVGPRDGLHLLASVRPRISDPDSPILLRHEVAMFGPPDSAWVRADSGIGEVDSAGVVYALAAWYYTGHTPPQPVLGWTATTPLRGHPAGALWEAPARERGFVASMDVTPKWFGVDAWAAGATRENMGDAAVFRSKDGGMSWNVFVFPRALFSMAFAVAVAPGHPDTAYASIDGHVRRTTDGGATWDDVFSLPVGRVIALACDPSNPAHVYAGSDAPDLMLHRSTDLGRSWQRILPAVDQHPAAITCMTVALLDTVPMGRPARRGLFIGTRGTGVWLYELDSEPVEASTPPAPAAARFTVYPNPASEAVSVTMELPYAQQVRIDAFDMLGRCVSRRTYGELAPGVHVLSFPAAELHRGVYLLRGAGRSVLLRVLR
jgi:hypothetical protein